MADSLHVQNVIQGLRALREEPLSIIGLSEPISAAPTSHRTSDVSEAAFENPSPASLEADLSHYKELFSKLRFSYLEQVTKEKFLRAIVGDPSLIVEHTENLELESQLAEIKAVLKAQKEYVGEMVKELDVRGRDLSRRYETITLQTTLLSSLPPQIEELDHTLVELRKQNQSAGNDTNETNLEMALPLPATLQLVEERKARLEEVNRQLKSLQQAVPRQTRVLESEERELRKLEGERGRAVQAAREAVERKSEGGGADELEMRGRWLRGVEGAVRGMLEVEG
ncbi:hypothetical protein OEA41_005766 [Lepraria neglecta]|uniref:Kinetochore protein Sos7 coiled-coil domain-containing protein n=1 Tax=Lepraria neglecta TaxID=209136 RepID=A0AAD9Z6M8_9LECA|nr:hypothetical protein OEA41_005766 [Lepraria neglecta]